ncbi:ABC transporter substrate-binding protein [Oceanobacillus alkalisoli]|uniref:ABC transporter substrate-binding protein n=1 Tax=Oceanobacillus alkalisoli TaxID=2925113 RepID=UPI001EEFCA4C|nr:ABC transporter substrate-binding protein [Oceanobacillus alkalisoli]MCF3943542.1 ABC transporter substrate-binding protein [Oceanobacillus alkalisoli]MCG5102807.1 ABC transporter substrate-binding protein [Oceanobacillus alkalisoli]
MRKIVWTLLTIGLLLLTACGSSDTEATESSDNENADGEVYNIGATQIVEHPSLDAAYEGFQQALEDAGLNVEYDFDSAQNDQNNVKPISDSFVADGVDLIFANSTPSALGALQATSEIPILFTSVTDAVEAKLVDSMEEPGGNVTGVVDLHPEGIQSTVQFIAEYFPDAAVGTVYNAGEQNSVTQVNTVKEAAEEAGLSVVERTVANTSEVQQAIVSLVEDVDVLYIITDNTVVSALDSVVGVANDHEIPLIVGEPDSLAKGGFATFGIDYHTIGYRTGEMAVDILTNDKSPSEIPVEYPAEMQLFINKEAAEAQNVEWHSDWDEDAQFIE